MGNSGRTEKMRTEEKKHIKNSIGRLIFSGLFLLVQLAWITVRVMFFSRQWAWISALSGVVALVVVLRLYGSHSNSAFKMPWIMLILLWPVFGLLMYSLLGRSVRSRCMAKRIQAVDGQLLPALQQNEATAEALAEWDGGCARQSGYLWRCAGYPVYQNTAVTYYSQACEGLEAQLADLKSAQHSIFMEYHAIEDGESFHRIAEVLAERAAAGVDVRLLYDDMGSIALMNSGFLRKMKEAGIQVRGFNPVLPVLNLFMNHRDHRKITVIDGRVGFTGGYNLANEYFGITHPYGHWKDTGIRLEGEAVRSLTAMFLEMWSVIAPGSRRKPVGVEAAAADAERYLGPCAAAAGGNGFVQPFADNPLDELRVGEDVYMGILKNARRYVYITTPYLILSDELSRELCQAVQSGVDVRIITAGIPDKKLVFSMTRSYYARLAMAGVRIYEYTPGFCHAKQWVSDDRTAVVGTINLDFRSLYLHFENAVLLHGCEAVRQVRADVERTLPLCEEVTERYRAGRSTVLRIGQCILRLFAPLV